MASRGKWKKKIKTRDGDDKPTTRRRRLQTQIAKNRWRPCVCVCVCKSNDDKWMKKGFSFMRVCWIYTNALFRMKLQRDSRRSFGCITKSKRVDHRILITEFRSQRLIQDHDSIEWFWVHDNDIIIFLSWMFYFLKNETFSQENFYYDQSLIDE